MAIITISTMTTTNVTTIITKIIFIKSKVLVITMVVLEREWWLAGEGDCSNFHESESQRVTHTTFTLNKHKDTTNANTNTIKHTHKHAENIESPTPPSH